MTEPQDPFAAPGGQPTPPPPTPPPPTPVYGTPPPAPAYGAPPAYGQPYAATPQYAGWGARVQSALIDWFLPGVVADVVYYASHALGLLLLLAAIAWMVYNRYLEGTTGQSVGKKAAGTRLLRSQDGQVIGAGMAILRMFVHIVDGIPCYLGYLWPLWDAQKQTFADKILGTLVVKA